jgi:hypothetical protein
MIARMKHRLLGRAVALLTLLASPLVGLAQENETKIYDARLEGYGTNVTLDSGGSGLTWLLLIVLAALCLGVLFKTSGRSHLD